jgi:hypothetical protein
MRRPTRIDVPICIPQGHRRPDLPAEHYRIVDTVKHPTSPAHTLATFVVEDAHPGAQPAG